MVGMIRTISHRRADYCGTVFDISSISFCSSLLNRERNSGLFMRS